MELAAIVKRCDAIVSSDTGTLHIAGALNIPTIGIFGSIPPIVRTIYYKNCFVIKADEKIDCSPCFDRQFGDRKSFYSCMHKDTRCMRSIKPSEVYKRLEYVLFKKDKVACDFCGTYDVYFYDGYGKLLIICNHCGRQLVRSKDVNQFCVENQML